MAHDRRPDPLTMLTQTMRRMADLRFDDIARGMENFANPSARGMLESLGRTREEQIESLAAMLRNSSEDEINEMGMVFGQAMAKLAEERATGAQPTGAQPTERQPRRSRPTSAERRQQRRLAS